MVAIVDADSLVWSACVKQKKDPDDDGYIHDIDEAKAKFDEKLSALIEACNENDMGVDSYVVFVQGAVNFREFILPAYKAKRRKRPKPPLLQTIKSHAISEYDAWVCNGAETDDFVASYWAKQTSLCGNDSAVIIANDKDYKQLPCVFMDSYFGRFGELSIVDPEEARYSLYYQMMTGDSADEYNFLKGKGVKHAKKVLSVGDSEYALRRKVYKEYLNHYKSRSEARRMFEAAYYLVKLRQDIRFLPEVVF